MGSLLSCFGAGTGSTEKNANNLNNKTAICLKEDKTKQSCEYVKAITPTPSQNEGRKKNLPHKHIFIWKINGFASLLEQGKGRTYTSFKMHGIHWLFSVNLMDKKVTLRLKTASISLSPDYMLQTKLKFFIHNQTQGKHINREASHTYSIACDQSEVACMIPLSTLKSPREGFLVDDTIVLGVEFIKFKRVPCNSVQRNTMIHKNKSSGLCTWYIDDFFQLTKPAALSEPFQMAGCTWRLRLDSESKFNKNYLAIYLILEDNSGSQIRPSSGALVEVFFSIKRQSHGSLIKRIRCTFGPTVDSFGDAKFIGYEDFVDPSKGYLIKGTCTIEASVCILGSSADHASKEAA